MHAGGGGASGGRRRVAIVNLGCKVNRHDGLAAFARLDPRQVDLVDADQEADLYVVNSCSVTHSAGAQSLKAARQIARRHPGRPIVFTGCHASVSADAARELPGVVATFPVDRRDELPGAMARLLELPDTQRAPATRSIEEYAGLRRPMVKVQDGCDQRCAYCVIPLARGASRSEPRAQVRGQVRALEQAGFAEAVITGIHLGAYGADLRPANDLARLLEELLAATERIRLRLSSLDPLEITPAIADLVLGHPRVCRYLHVPLQSGCARILEAMRRPYGPDEVAARLAALSAADDALCLGLDVIVGFPGEDAAAFGETLRLLEGLDFSYLHVFPFSPRPGTAAAALGGRPPEREVKERGAILRALSDRRRRRFYQRQRGRRVEIVTERHLASSAWSRGTSDNYLDVVVETQRPLGALVAVELRGDGRPCEAVELVDEVQEARR